jgi:secreted trypsin-like serine protease
MPYRIAAALACALVLVAPAAAIVGGAEPASEAVARHVVMVVGARGSACTGTAIARNLVLTAAHCLQPGARHSVVAADAGRSTRMTRVESFERHSEFDLETSLEHRETPDVALVKLAEPLPSRVLPAAIGTRDFFLIGDRFIVAGYGIDIFRGAGSFGTLRSAMLMAMQYPSSLQLRLADPATRGERAGLGVCSGDSGGPVFEDSGGRLTLVAVISWSTGPNDAGCGGLTGVTPLARYRDWIVTTAGKLGRQD